MLELLLLGGGGASQNAYINFTRFQGQAAFVPVYVPRFTKLQAQIAYFRLTPIYTQRLLAQVATVET